MMNTFVTAGQDADCMLVVFIVYSQNLLKSFLFNGEKGFVLEMKSSTFSGQIVFPVSLLVSNKKKSFMHLLLLLLSLFKKYFISNQIRLLIGLYYLQIVCFDTFGISVSNMRLIKRCYYKYILLSCLFI